MKVLVTGATGFIGSNIINALLDYKDINIIATTRNIEKAKKIQWFHSSNVKTIEFDIALTNHNIFNKLGKPDILIHMAWDGLHNYNDLLHIEDNLHKNYFFIKDIINGGLQDLTVAGTCYEYGMKNGCLSENIETDPVSSYAIAKDSLRRFLQEFQKIREINLKWVRFFYLYGKYQSAKSLLTQLEETIKKNEKIFNMSGGEQLRDYLPIEKAAQYVIKIAFQNKISGIINCCSGKPISIRTFVENYIKEKKADIELNLGFYPYLSYEPMAFWGDNRKLKNILKGNK